MISFFATARTALTRQPTNSFINAVGETTLKSLWPQNGQALPNLRLLLGRVEQSMTNAEELAPYSAKLHSEDSAACLSRILSPSFYSAQQRQQLVRQRVMAAFARHASDTGSPEVQAARWTCQMLSLQRHIDVHGQDKRSRRFMTELVHRRVRMLRYLRSLDLGRYHRLLDSLDLPHSYCKQWDEPYRRKATAKAQAGKTRPFVPRAPCIHGDRHKPQVVPKAQRPQTLEASLAQSVRNGATLHQ